MVMTDRRFNPTCLLLRSVSLLLLILAFAGLPLSAEEAQSAFTNSLGMPFARIPAGSFLMGSPADELLRGSDERQHKVTLSRAFYLQTTEVTQQQWKAVMGDNPARFSGCGQCPVENISWFDAQRFVQRLNQREKTKTYRLPTEAEWEYACRANTTDPFSFGKYLSTDQANYNGNHPIPGSPRGDNRRQTIPVGGFPANAFGLYDMHGNVYEWCQDWYGPYPEGPITDPTGAPSGYSRVTRGGGMSSYARRCRSANRTKHLPGYTSFYIGMRVAKTLP